MTRLLPRAALLVLALCGVAWLGGFVWFVQQAGRARPAPPRSDGIVVLTGGSERIAAGLRLLAGGSAARLLVSGVGPGTDAARLLRAAGFDPRLASRVTLGQSAVSTHGNAEETVEWVRRDDLHSLIVVTAFYHMPRALAELRHALPGIALHPAAVEPPADQARRLQLLASEYTKWLAVEAGLPRPAATDRRPGAGLR